MLEPSSRGETGLKTIGVLLNRMDDDLAQAVILGLQTMAAQQCLRLVFFPGGHLHAKNLFSRQFNLLFDLAYRIKLDGVLAITNAFQSGTYAEEIEQLFACFGTTPLVSSSFISQTCPSVVIDNRGGSEQLFRHLIEDHGYTRIAYMRGTEGHSDEDERFIAYLEMLKNNNLMFDPDLVVQGQFDHASGRLAMERLLARNVAFDVLVAANDEMAMAALSVANEHKLHVPGDFAICGFDDFPSSHREAPPITNVAQPTAYQTAIALNVLLDKIAAKPVVQVTKLPMRLVIRQSCGCVAARTGPGQSLHKTSVSTENITESIRCRDSILSVLGLPHERENVYRSYLLFMEHGLNTAGVAPWMDVAIGEFAYECLMVEGDVSHLQRLLFYIQHYVRVLFPTWAESPDQLIRTGEQLQKWQMIITQRLRHYQSYVRMEMRTEQELATSFFKSNITDFSLSSIADLFEQTLNYLSIKTGYLAVYPKGFDYKLFGGKVAAEVKILVAIDDEIRNSERENKIIDVAALISEPIALSGNAQSLVVLPIFQNSQHYGLMVLDISSVKMPRVEWFRHEISSLLIGAILTEELQQQQVHLQQDLDLSSRQNARLIKIADRDELTGLLNRRGFFRRAPLLGSGKENIDILLLFIDLDEFKAINDNFGHAEGDQALIAAANIISNSFREDDLVSRLSGDEFVVMSLGYTQEKIALLKQRIYDQFELYNTTSGKASKLRCSLGYYLFNSRDIDQLETFIGKADEFLYEEKRQRKLRKV